MDRTQQSSNLMDTHNRLIADVLTRYRALVNLATAQARGLDDSSSPEAMAVNGIAMKIEFDGFYKSVKELLALSRRLKELWLFGGLAKDDADAKETEEQVRADALGVAEMVNALEGDGLRKLVGQHGGTWEGVEKQELEVRAEDGTAQKSGEAVASAAAPVPP